MLGALDDKIELNRQMNETMAQAIFKDWLVAFCSTRAKTEGREPYLAPELWTLFLHKEFAVPNVQKLPVEQAVAPIIESRLEEARRAIDAASDVGTLKPDVQKFNQGLRDFRNYIHPYQQMMSGFSPDEHTMKVCFQVLKAALASVAGERRWR